MAKKNPWALARDDDDGLEASSPAVPTPGTTWETKEVHKNWIANTAEEVAKADETWRAGQLVDALNDETTRAGVETIERNVALSRQPRDERAQPMVDEYLARRTNKANQQREAITDDGVKGIRNVVNRPLTPKPEPEKKKKGLFDW